MLNAVFVAPFFAETTIRFIDAAAGVDGVQLGLISQDPEDRLPPSVREKLGGHFRVTDGLSTDALGGALEAMSRGLGGIDRLLGTLEQLQIPLGELRDRFGIHGMGASAARNFRDKSRMKDVLAQAALPCARHKLVSTADEATRFARDIGFPLVAKPPAGAGAQSTFRLDHADALQECLASMPPSPGRPTLLEEFIVGEEHSYDSVVLNGKLVWHSINDYSPAPIEVLRHPWIQWTVVSPRDVDHPSYEPIQAVAGPALTALGLDSGLSHMEWFRRPDGTVAISEVGARPPGAQFATILSYAHDFDFYRAWAELMLKDAWAPPPRGYAVGAAYLRAQGSGRRVGAIHGLEQARHDVGDLVVEAKLPVLGQTPSGSYEGDGYVILRHPDTDVVRQAVTSLVERIYVELS